MTRIAGEFCCGGKLVCGSEPEWFPIRAGYRAGLRSDRPIKLALLEVDFTTEGKQLN